MLVSTSTEGEGDDAAIQSRLGQRRVRGGDHRFRYRSDRDLRGERGSVVVRYGVGPNGEGEGSIGVDVAVEFQFDGDFRVADALDAEGYAVNTRYRHGISDVRARLLVSIAAEGEGDDASMQRRLGQWSRC